MTSAEIRQKFLQFFKKHEHVIIPSASLVTPDEKGVTNATLFNTAGMQPLVPYLLGKVHPQGKRLVDVQKCLRTVDIDDIGDKTHATFFEMLGNWSLGDYFKEDAIRWSYEFLTSKEEGLGLDPKRLYITVFAGDKNSDKDIKSVEIWKSVGILERRIYFKGADSNWWPAVKDEKTDSWTGPTGPCSEMFYDITSEGLGDLTQGEFEKFESEQKIVEIWNDVFMEFEKVDGKIIGRLSKSNVDTGAGLERLSAVLQNVDNIYDTDLLKPVMDLMAKANNSIESKRIIADHLRASVFLISDGVIPSNADRGYILRRLIRRAIVNMPDKKLDEKRISIFVDTLVSTYAATYPQLAAHKENIKKVLNEECLKFAEALQAGIKEFEKISKKGSVSSIDAFTLFSSFGLPIDVTNGLAKERGLSVDVAGFEVEMKKHQELSRTSSAGMFKGGLADTSENTIKLHTAHHLLLKALQIVLGFHVKQRGSNITSERLRIDFSHNAKMTDEQKKEAERIMNEKIAEDLPVIRSELAREEAEKIGAEREFGQKYPDRVSVYSIGPESATLSNPQFSKAFSIEFCGGPHVTHTGEIGKVRITKEEAVSAGVRRIRAVLAD